MHHIRIPYLGRLMWELNGIRGITLNMHERNQSVTHPCGIRGGSMPQGRCLHIHTFQEEAETIYMRMRMEMWKVESLHSQVLPLVGLVKWRACYRLWWCLLIYFTHVQGNYVTTAHQI